MTAACMIDTEPSTSIVEVAPSDWAKVTFDIVAFLVGRLAPTPVAARLTVGRQSVIPLLRRSGCDNPHLKAIIESSAEMRAITAEKSCYWSGIKAVAPVQAGGDARYWRTMSRNAPIRRGVGPGLYAM